MAMEEEKDDVAVVLGTQAEYGEGAEIASYVGSYEDVAKLSTRTIAGNIKKSVEPCHLDKYIAVWLVVEGRPVEKNEYRFDERELEDPHISKRIVEAQVLETITRWRQ